MRRVGRGHDVLLDHQRSEVVASEAERDLPDFHSHRHPARLQVGNVVEDDPCDGHRAEILVSAGLWLIRHRRRVLGLKWPANESRKSARPRLYITYALEMLHSLGKSFADAVHHRDRGLHSLAVCKLHDLEPSVRAGLLSCHEVAHSL